MSHAVARLRAARLALLTKPFMARGSRVQRCSRCRVPESHCLCALRPVVRTRAGVCLIMGDLEPLKPSNTGWLIADVVSDTAAFGWSRTAVDPALLALLADPQWEPFLVFPGEFVAPERLVPGLPLVNAQEAAQTNAPGSGQVPRRPLFVLLDGTWPEAGKMFRKSPYLDHLPVLSLKPEQLSTYRLRRSTHDDHLCTSEVATLCLALAGETRAAEALAAYQAVFTLHYLNGKQSWPVDWDDALHRHLRGYL